MPGSLPDEVIIGAGSALGTAALAWLGQRLVGKAAIQTAINTSFKELMDQLRQELKVALRERDEARALATDLADKLRMEVWQRGEHIQTIDELERKVEVLERTIVALEERPSKASYP